MGYLVSDRPTEFTGIGPLPGWLISRRTENARSLLAPRRPRRRASSCLVVLLVEKQQRFPWWLSAGPLVARTSAPSSTGTVKDTFINRLTSMRTGNRSLLVLRRVPFSLLFEAAAMRTSRGYTPFGTNWLPSRTDFHARCYEIFMLFNFFPFPLVFGLLLFFSSPFSSVWNFDLA